MALLTSYQQQGEFGEDYAWAYSDPDLPGLNTLSGSRAGDLAANYWPLWSDVTYFPVPSGQAGAAWALQRSEAYANLVSNSGLLGGFANIIGATIAAPTGVSSIQSSLDDAYQDAYGTSPPSPPGQGEPFPVQGADTAQDAVYEFLYNANLLRQNAFSVLTGSGGASAPTTLSSWIQGFINTIGGSAGVP
ncbi:hypothetical protein [Singulisphaera sp. PoT]|uniref:hypothetical protein n=1 Tax=Singulisphaera sp. PoT TaxID=3411797 RepID=UPI003BF5DB9F